MNCFLCSLWALNRSIIANPANSECMRLNAEEEKCLSERHFIHPCHGSFLCPFLPVFIYPGNDKYLSSSSHEAGPVLSSGSTGGNKQTQAGLQRQPQILLKSTHPFVNVYFRYEVQWTDCSRHGLKSSFAAGRYGAGCLHPLSINFRISSLSQRTLECMAKIHIKHLDVLFSPTPAHVSLPLEPRSID